MTPSYMLNFEHVLFKCYKKSGPTFLRIHQEILISLEFSLRTLLVLLFLWIWECSYEWGWTVWVP